ncbi:hypothetical protein ACH4VR_15795 [Streptomyces sp. NPDC020883]|uniref:hypothetical protein n=1 Tax=Streptomyces sp. NPDC020883 TaxID=3365099 RepID=UPI0037AAF933
MKSKLSVSPGTVKLGQNVYLKGQGDGDALKYAKFRAQERVGTHGAWHTVKCGRVVTMGAGEAKADMKVKAGHRGVLQFRGMLYGVDGPCGGHSRADITTRTKTVHVRRPGARAVRTTARSRSRTRTVQARWKTTGPAHVSSGDRI